MPGSPSFHIGALAQRTGRSIHTIRWYEAQGLIPGVERDGGGRRVYGDLHVGWLDLMDRLRRSGMSIAEHRAALRLIDAKVGFYDDWIATGQRPKNDPNRRASARRST